MKGGALALVILALAFPSSVHAASGPVVTASTYRVDVGELDPGESVAGTIGFASVGDAPAAIDLRIEDAPSFVTLDLASFTLAPGATREVAYHLDVPVDAPPGNHGESIRILVRDANAPEDAGGGASLTAATAIVVTERTRGVGVTAIEAPSSILPNGTFDGRVLVVNTGANETTTGVEITLVSKTSGQTQRVAQLQAQAVAPDATVAFPYTLTPDASGFPRGSYELRAVVAGVVPNGTPAAANIMTVDTLVGVRQYAMSFTHLVDQKDGVVFVELAVENTGDVPITAHPRVVFTPSGGGDAIGFDLSPVALGPGESKTVQASLSIAGGAAYRVSATDATRGGPPLAISSAPTAELQVARAASSAAGLRLWPFVAVAIALVVGAGGAAAFRYRKRLASLKPAFLARAAPTGGSAVLEAPAAPRPAPAAPAVVPAAPVAAPAAPRPAPAAPAEDTVVLLLDLCTLNAPEPELGGIILQAEEAAHHEGTVEHARAFYVGRSQEDVRAHFLALHDAGLDATVSVAAKGAARNCHVTLSIEAQRHAADARTFVIATHDANFAPLLAALRAQGKRVVLLGKGDVLPIELLANADEVRTLA